MEQQRTLETAEVSMIEPEVVVEIKTLAGLRWGSQRIADELGISRKTVKRYLRGPVEKQVRLKARCLDAAGEELARQLFLDVAEGNAVVVKDLLAQRGYEISERTVQQVVSTARREKKAADVATARFETSPGAQMQIDFGEKKVHVGAAVVVIHLMAAVLGYSRRIFVKAFLAERAEDWRDGIACAFRHFGGVTKALLIDNTRCLVTGRDAEGKPILHPGLVQLCKDFDDLAVHACRPYRARTKGKIESGVKFVKRNGLAGRKFASFAELEAHLSSWMAHVDGRVHGTTNEVPNERFVTERPALRPLPSPSIRVRERRLMRKVSNDAFVDIDTVRYSVPPLLVRAKVEVDVGDARVRIYDGAKLVADHARSKEPHSQVIDKVHHAGLWRATQETPAPSPSPASPASPLAAYVTIVDGAQRGAPDSEEGGTELPPSPPSSPLLRASAPFTGATTTRTVTTADDSVALGGAQ
jgi:transposase